MRPTPRSRGAPFAAASSASRREGVGRSAGSGRTTYRARVFERFLIPIARDRATTSFPVPSSPSHTSSHQLVSPVAACPMVFALGCAPEPERTLSFRPPLASPSVKPSDPSTSSVSSYTATVAGATTRSGWWSSANARQVRWFRSLAFPSNPPVASRAPPGDHASVFTPIPWAFASFGRMAWSSRPSGAYRHTAWLVAPSRIASVVASGLHETSAASLTAPGSRTKRLALVHVSQSITHTWSLPSLRSRTARKRPSAEKSRPRSGNLGARRWRHEPSTRDHAETRTAKSATIKTSVPAGDQSARAIPAGPSSIVHVQESSETEKHCTTPRACIAARTWSESRLH